MNHLTIIKYHHRHHHPLRRSSMTTTRTTSFVLELLFLFLIPIISSTTTTTTTGFLFQSSSSSSSLSFSFINRPTIPTTTSTTSRSPFVIRLYGSIFRGRGMPYVESYQEQCLHELLWRNRRRRNNEEEQGKEKEKKKEENADVLPFQTAMDIVTRVLFMKEEDHDEMVEDDDEKDSITKTSSLVVDHVVPDDGDDDDDDSNSKNSNNNNNNNNINTLPLLYRWDCQNTFGSTSTTPPPPPPSSPPTTRVTGYEALFNILYKHRHHPRHHDSYLSSSSSSVAEGRKGRKGKQGLLDLDDDKVQHFALTVAYRGTDFCGWQRQPNNFNLPSVQAMLEDSLQLLIIEKQQQRQQQLNNNPRRIPQKQSPKKKQLKQQHQYRVDIRVCGRTDAGVHALGQICRFRTSNKNISIKDIYTHLSSSSSSSSSSAFKIPYQKFRMSNNTTTTTTTTTTTSSTTSTTAAVTATTTTTTTKYPPSIPTIPSLGLKCTHIQHVTRSFHPTFGATCRAYVYLIDMDDSSKLQTPTSITTNQLQRLNNMLQYLEGKDLDYYGMSSGKLTTQTTNCTIYHAKACWVSTTTTTTSTTNNNYDTPSQPLSSSSSSSSSSPPRTALCIELVGNRFLRRMVRLLVSTSLQLVLEREPPPPSLSLSSLDNIENKEKEEEKVVIKNDEKKEGEYDDYDPSMLYNIIKECDRTLTGKPAPPQGLIFVGARFGVGEK